MSPVALPVTIHDQTTQKGNLFTMFLHSPLVAFCYICDIADVPIALWENCQAMVNKLLGEVAAGVGKSKTIGGWSVLGWSMMAHIYQLNTVLSLHWLLLQ